MAQDSSGCCSMPGKLIGLTTSARAGAMTSPFLAAAVTDVGAHDAAGTLNWLVLGEHAAASSDNPATSTTTSPGCPRRTGRFTPNPAVFAAAGQSASPYAKAQTRSELPQAPVQNSQFHWSTASKL
jgi:hypothetical protein